MVRKLIKKRSKKIGLPPGSMVHIGEKKIEKPRLTIIDYDADRINKVEIKEIEEAFPFKDTPTVTWLNIDGLHDVSLLQKIGAHYNIHPLILEDILNTDQYPKIEILDDFIFIVLKMISFNNGQQQLDIEQLSLVLGPNYVITFQERIGDIFNPIRERLQKSTGRIRRNGPDYLCYALMDVVVDNYFLVLEKLGASIEQLDDRILENPEPVLAQDIQGLKRELIFLRKSVWPLREVVSTMQREETALLKSATAPYIRDLYDHIVQIIDTIETYRDLVSGLLDIYLSNLSNRMNEVMKVLTIIATIFIPLTFIAGIYGMNFEYMPELTWHWSYPVVWAVMVLVVLVMLFYFRRKKWV